MATDIMGWSQMPGLVSEYSVDSGWLVAATGEHVFLKAVALEMQKKVDTTYLFKM